MEEQTKEINQTVEKPGTPDGENLPKLEGQELIEALCKQIEYYFSKENLMRDAFLLSQMNSEYFVPISVIANFKRIRDLTNEWDVLVKAMRECKAVSVSDDGQNIKPNIKTQRNTIILREIPQNTPVEEVKSIFDNEKCGIVEEIKSDIGDYWFVSFEDDETVVDTLEFIRGQSFKGKPIKARIKTENTLRTFQSTATSNAVATPDASNSFVGNYNYGRGGYMPYGGGWMMPPYGGYNQWDESGSYPGRYNSGRGFGGSYRGRKSRGYAGGGARGGGRGSDRGGRRRGSGAPQHVPNLGPANFPPLVPQNDGGKPTGGYQISFTKYTKEAMIEAFKNTKNFPKKESSEHNMFLDEPNFELEIEKPFPKKDLRDSQVYPEEMNDAARTELNVDVQVPHGPIKKWPIEEAPILPGKDGTISKP